MITAIMEDIRSTVSLYLQSPYVLEVVAVLIFSVGMIPPLRNGLSVAWHQLCGWRRVFLALGWMFLGFAGAVWLALMYLTISAWRVAVEDYYPKPASLVFVILGGFLYFFLVVCAGASFTTASGSAQDDIARKLGVRR